MNRYAFIKNEAVTQVPDTCWKLQEALIDLKEEGNDYISVRMLTDKAGLDRLEFYDYYDRVDDVECQMENLLIGYLLETGDDDYLEHTLSWIGENRRRITYLIKNQKSGRFYLKWRNAIRYHLVEWGIVDENQENTYIIAGISGLIISMFTLNISEEHDVDLAHFEDRIRDISTILYERSKKKNAW